MFDVDPVNADTGTAAIAPNNCNRNNTNNNNDVGVVVADNRYNDSPTMARIFGGDDVVDGYGLGDDSNAADTICIQSVAEFNSSDLVLPDQIFCAQIKQKCKESIDECPWNGMPTMERIYNKSPVLRVFGQLNEVEYSSNAKFDNTVIYVNEEQRDRVNSMVRYYYQTVTTLYVNTANSRIQSKCRDPYNDVPVPCTVTVRFDYDPMDAIQPRQVTAKLKIVKTKFNFVGSTFNLTGAVEVPIHTLHPARNTLQLYTNSRQVYYWYCCVNNTLFRVAFRENLMLKQPSTFYKDRNYTLNIECEDDTVEPLDFVIGYNLLFKYYKAQYMTTHGVIMPEWNDINTLNIADLTDYQRRLLATMTFPTIAHIEDGHNDLGVMLSASSQYLMQQPPPFNNELPMYGIYDFVGRLATSQYTSQFLDRAANSMVVPSPLLAMTLDEDDCFVSGDSSATIDGDDDENEAAAAAVEPMPEPDEFFLEYRGRSCNKFNDVRNLDKCGQLTELRQVSRLFATAPLAAPYIMSSSSTSSSTSSLATSPTIIVCPPE